MAESKPEDTDEEKKSLTIDECLGYAIGAVGMTYGDFCNLTPEQFGEVCKAYNEASEHEYRNGWEMTRVNAAICVQPHCKKTIRPTDVLRLPWDEEHSPQPIRMSKEEQLKRMEELRKEWEKEKTNQ